jgi:hypothetical protein
MFQLLLLLLPAFILRWLYLQPRLGLWYSISVTGVAWALNTGPARGLQIVICTTRTILPAFHCLRQFARTPCNPPPPPPALYHAITMPTQLCDAPYGQTKQFLQTSGIGWLRPKPPHTSSIVITASRLPLLPNPACSLPNLLWNIHPPFLLFSPLFVYTRALTHTETRTRQLGNTEVQNSMDENRKSCLVFIFYYTFVCAKTSSRKVVDKPTFHAQNGTLPVNPNIIILHAVLFSCYRYLEFDPIDRRIIMHSIEQGKYIQYACLHVSEERGVRIPLEAVM